jgi:PLP dependent protein
MTVLQTLGQELRPQQVALIAVSKTKPKEAIEALYALGQRAFGENRVQEMVEKHNALPTDIEWHFIGHLQSKKVKSIVPFVHLIHSVDSFKLLKEIQKQAKKLDRKVNVLLQQFIAQEETKYGLDKQELIEILEYYRADNDLFSHVHIVGLMGMATFTDNKAQVRAEFKMLKELFDFVKEGYLMPAHFKEVSMGMSGDYKIAVEEGSTMVRIGSMLFGVRG